MILTGTVDNKGREWQRAGELRLYNRTVSEGTDYALMSYEDRAIDLDTWEAPPGHVVTGVKLRKLNTGHLSLEIRVSSNTVAKICFQNHFKLQAKLLYWFLFM